MCPYGNSIYVGIDESNNGSEGFEIPVAIFSRPTDKNSLFSNFPKSRRLSPYYSIQSIVPSNNFTFTAFPNNLFKRNLIKRKGLILSSLISHDLPDDLEDLRLFFDGEFTKRQRNYLKDYVSEYCNIDRDSIKLLCKGKLDRTCSLVNQADRLAYFIYKRFDINQACFHPNYRSVML